MKSNAEENRRTGPEIYSSHAHFASPMLEIRRPGSLNSTKNRTVSNIFIHSAMGVYDKGWLDDRGRAIRLHQPGTGSSTVGGLGPLCSRAGRKAQRGHSVTITCRETTLLWAARSPMGQPTSAGAPWGGTP